MQEINGANPGVAGANPGATEPLPMHTLSTVLPHKGCRKKGGGVIWRGPRRPESQEQTSGSGTAHGLSGWRQAGGTASGGKCDPRCSLLHCSSRILVSLGITRGQHSLLLQARSRSRFPAAQCWLAAALRFF